MAAFKTSLMLILASICGASSWKSVTSTCEMMVELNTAVGEEPVPICSNQCTGDQTASWYEGVMYQQFRELEHQLMVAVKYEGGVLASCTTVPYVSFDDLASQEAARDEILEAFVTDAVTEIDAVNITRAPVVYTCPEGFSKFEDSKCYKSFSSLKMSWTSASASCKSKGMTLARVESSDEQKFIQGLITQTIWIDLNDRLTEGVFLYSNGGGSKSYTNWSHGEPSKYGCYDDCVEMTKSTHYGWSVEKCSYKRSFVCETTTTQS